MIGELSFKNILCALGYRDTIIKTHRRYGFFSGSAFIYFKSEAECKDFISKKEYLIQHFGDITLNDINDKPVSKSPEKFNKFLEDVKRSSLIMILITNGII